MALLEEWQKIAYDQQADRGKLQKFWQRYFMLEKGVYEKLLTNPDEKVEGTVKRAGREIRPQHYGYDWILRWNQ